MGHPKWVYHPTKGAKIVDSYDATQLLKSGWYYTPADFPTESDVSDSGEFTKGDLAAMTYSELVDTCKRVGVSVPKKASNDEIRKLISKEIWPE